MVQRVTYRRRLSYNTKSNRTRVVKTPGGRLVVHYMKKKPKGVSCGDCGVQLHGVKCMRGMQQSRAAKSDLSVNRAYGGSRCPGCVRSRITRAFLVEEQKIVKRVLKAAAAKEAAKAKKKAKKAKKKTKSKK
ncbi:50S ribosomal protein L34e [Thecamonas trahens ATCC 50062]|uniref:Large ribosomal subunit protein eL34 n=1 Tax=Thecamonas trahens ATCC 50062 TaxID=461836 RepID=A0A0L0D8L3_THETB|nr:50S ribosomal protein L34e [Thecamonas trahens ATCC 50062]KNC48717.1 50S ribosomal protein L34e [Thecamonas trahens ATCC 50062]|eukprot:XP_013762769.1 50S ribosomal protein L34e [Thecamonas trahens ATCC 50062]